MLKTRKVVIIGSGHVGSHVALNLIQSGEADEIALIDIVPHKAAAQAMDLDDGIAGALCRRVALDLLGVREDAEECVSDTSAVPANPAKPVSTCSMTPSVRPTRCSAT